MKVRNKGKTHVKLNELEWLSVGIFFLSKFQWFGASFKTASEQNECNFRLWQFRKWTAKRQELPRSFIWRRMSRMLQFATTFWARRGTRSESVFCSSFEKLEKPKTLFSLQDLAHSSGDEYRGNWTQKYTFDPTSNIGNSFPLYCLCAPR